MAKRGKTLVSKNWCGIIKSFAIPSTFTFLQNLIKLFSNAYSRVPNKRGGGVRIIRGLEMVRYGDDRGVGIIRGVLGETENSPFLR